jgi:serine/threonine protein kinase
MSVPSEPRLKVETAAAPSARSDVDETVASPPAADASTVCGFDPPAAGGEVGTLGPYRVVKELGRGGMGAVYAAVDTRLDRQIALKVMLPASAADANAKGRFLREARAAARIKHDNVVTVYEADERLGVPYIAMEFLDGYPLDGYLKKKGNPAVPQVLRIAAEVAAGLAAAHKIGLVHRDIKPANLWLEAPHGRVKVLDFGLAKPVNAEVELTQSGAIVGTPAYMSPEQARGEKVDSRTDLFSLGGVLYRLCTGKLPFPGPSTMAVLTALGTQEPPPVRDVNPDVPEQLAALIHQLLAKRADARPQSAAEVVKRLRAIAATLATPRALPVNPSASEPQVVYVPIEVTAAPDASPFADLDEPDTESASRAPVAAPVRKKPGRRWRAVAAGFAAFSALVLCGVIVVIRNKDGTETKIEVPDGATVTVKGKDGKTLAQVGQELKPVVAADPDRKAAEWVIAQGGSVRVDGADEDIKAVAELPKDRFTVTQVTLDGTKVSDAGLVYLKDLKGLTELYLDGTKVTDAGLVYLKDLKGLTELTLRSTAVTDAGLARLKGLNGLTQLYLNSTAVTDAGLVHLKEFKVLTGLNLCNTAVTDAGMVHLKGLTWLSLNDTAVSDAGLERLKDLKGLTQLYLSRTAVTDAGLVHLKGLKGLTELYLIRAKVTDAGLVHLKELKGLTWLELRKTGVTAKGLEAFHAAVPACKVEHDGGFVEPRK